MSLSIFPSQEFQCPRLLAPAIILLLTAFSSFSVAAQPPQQGAKTPETGLWFDDTGQGAVEIAPCGDLLCGHIVWLRKPLGSNGKPIQDRNNPEPDMRLRPVCGIQVLGNLAPLEDGAWGGGWVYDPKVGKSYNVEIRLQDADLLEVFGYAGLRLLGRKLYWKRAPQNLPRCAQQDTAQQNARQ